LRKTIFIFSYPVTLTFDLYSCVSTKLEDSSTFRIRENRRQATDGRTDRRTWCNT